MHENIYIYMCVCVCVLIVFALKTGYSKRQIDIFFYNKKIQTLK
jgi:predicted adenine nucleotide alpha hydrolase (AANH) superfamily ATPase